MISRLADILVLKPSRHPVPAVGLSRRLIRFGNERIEVWWRRADSRAADRTDSAPDVYILKLVGAGGRAECVTAYPFDFWDDLITEVWAVNPPGFGGSSGRASLSTWDKAAQAVFDEIAKVADEKPIMIMANSLGTAAALSIAARREVAGLILRNPPPLRELIMGKYGWWNMGLGARLVASQVPRALDSIRLAKACRMPAIFISSAQDQTVPNSYQEQVRTVYAGPQQHLILSEAGHNTPMTVHETVEFYRHLSWLRDQILPQRSDSQSVRLTVHQP